MFVGMRVTIDDPNDVFHGYVGRVVDFRDTHAVVMVPFHGESHARLTAIPIDSLRCEDPDAYSILSNMGERAMNDYVKIS